MGRGREVRDRHGAGRHAGTNAYRVWSIFEADLVSSVDNSKLSGKPRDAVPASWQREKGSGVPSQQRG
jgi:hypothetical protein